MKKSLYIVFAAGLLMQSACKKALDVTPPGEFVPENVLTTEAGIKSVLFSSYGQHQNSTAYRFLINNSECCTDMAFNSGGNENLTLSQIVNFTWDASLGTFQVDVWGPSYRCIRDANIVINNLPTATMPDAKKALYGAEARFLRAFTYDRLYRWFGPVPLRLSADSLAPQARATDAEMRSFIESELLAAVTDLPNPGSEEAFGRANKGVALSALAKYYLQTKQWQKAADAAQQVIALNYYSLFPNYQTMFEVGNERSREMIYVIPHKNQEGFGNWYTAGALPPGYKFSPQIPNYLFNAGMANFATQYRMRTGFTNTFDTTNDKRATLLLRYYYNSTNAFVNLLSTADNVRAMKYWDNATVGNHSGNDIPLFRYADILLTRAEALNELSGPTQAALDLINQVRTRAGISNLTMAQATSQQVLRDLILRERGWEFYAEGHRREDRLRNGTFISNALARGITAAAPKHELFPIPQVEIDANKLCIQNTGY